MYKKHLEMQVDIFGKQGNTINKQSSCDNCIGRDRFSVLAF